MPALAFWELLLSSSPATQQGNISQSSQEVRKDISNGQGFFLYVLSSSRLGWRLRRNIMDTHDVTMHKA